MDVKGLKFLEYSECINTVSQNHIKRRGWER